VRSARGATVERSAASRSVSRPRPRTSSPRPGLCAEHRRAYRSDRVSSREQDRARRPAVDRAETEPVQWRKISIAPCRPETDRRSPRRDEIAVQRAVIGGPSRRGGHEAVRDPSRCSMASVVATWSPRPDGPRGRRPRRARCRSATPARPVPPDDLASETLERRSAAAAIGPSANARASSDTADVRSQITGRRAKARRPARSVSGRPRHQPIAPASCERRAFDATPRPVGGIPRTARRRACRS
jgi:hypothetical protein